MWDLIVSVPDHCLSFYFSYYQCQKQYYYYLLKVLAQDEYIDTYLPMIYVLTSSTMSVDVYSACVDFEFQNET